MPGQRVQPRQKPWRPCIQADAEATETMLHDLLFNKDVDEGPLDEALAKAHESGGVRAHDKHGVRASPLKMRQPSHAAQHHHLDVSPERVAAVANLSPAQLEEEQRTFVHEVCGDQSLADVQKWVGKIFLMQRAVQAQKDKRRRRRGGSAASDGGLSAQTGYTGFTGVTGTTGTALQAAGGSIAGKLRVPSESGGGSLVVHHRDVDEPLSVKEKLQAFLKREIPELQEHVNAHVENQTELLRREVDEQLAEQYLRTTSNRRVFDGRTNYVRWQHARQQVLQKRLEAAMSGWIMEAVESWNEKQAVEGVEEKPKDISEVDLVFDYLTKRAAHIDLVKLPSQLPVFKTLHSSYSLPSMWRDKYIQ